MNFLDFLEQISKNKKLEERIDIYQKASDLFQIRENEKNILDKRNTEIYERLEKFEKLSSENNVTELVKVKNRIEKEIERFGNVAANDNALKEASVIKQRRSTSITEFLKSVKDKSVQTFSNISEINGISPTSHMLTIVSTVLIAVITTILFLVDFDLAYVVVGLVFFLANLVVLIYTKRNHITKYEIDQNYTTYEEFISNLDKKENDFLLNVAWVNALRKELIRINDIISKFGNSDTNISLEEKNELIKNNQRINHILNTSIQPLEYFRVKDQLIDLQLEELNNLEDGEEPPKPDHVSIRIPSLKTFDEFQREKVNEFIDYIKDFYTIKREENAE